MNNNATNIAPEYGRPEGGVKGRYTAAMGWFINAAPDEAARR